MAGAGAALIASAVSARGPKPRESGLMSSHDALGLADLVRRKEVSPSELLEAAIERAEAMNPRFNFLAQKHYDYGRAAIARGLPQGPFTGVPWLLKDLNTYVAGEVTGQGSRLYAGYRPTVTSELVRRHERAGLVIFGKTTTPEFGLTATTESKATGLTRNPWNPDHIAGGSSGGAAAAVAAGVIPAAHATDGGGSIRIPASCCGLFGLKPSRGRVPMGPLRTEGWGGLSCHHAVTHSVRDSAALLDATQGLEPGSRYVAPTPERPYLEEVSRTPDKLRIALMVSPPAGSPVDPECVAATRAAAKLCESLGHSVEEVAPKLDVGALGQAAFVMMGASVANDLDARSKAIGVPLGPDVVEAVTMMFHDVGAKFTAMDWVKANNTFQEAAVTMAQFMDKYDLILSPVLASPPLKLGTIGLSPPDIQTWIRNITPFAAFTGLYNQTGQPSMSVPLAMSEAGLPIGIMFSARYGDEPTLFRLAGQLEQAASWAGRRPAIA